MNTARTAVDNEIHGEKAITDWNENNRANSRNKRSEKYRDLWKKWADYLALKSTRDPETVSEASYASTGTIPHTTPRNTHPYLVMDIPREIIENIPVFDGKPDELNQFLSTINSYTTMYNVRRVNLVMLRTRGKAHEIVSHAVTEDPDVEWSTISKKLISNYGTIKGNIEAKVKITKLQMKDDEPLGEYLAQTRTLIKTKLKNPLQWHTEYNDTDAFHVCNGLNKPRLKYHMLSRVHKMDSYKDLFANIEEEWSHGYFIEEYFAEEPKQEVNEIQSWDEQAPKDPQEALMYTEINYVYHKHGRQPPPYTSYQGSRPQGSGHPFTRGRGGGTTLRCIMTTWTQTVQYDHSQPSLHIQRTNCTPTPTIRPRQPEYVANGASYAIHNTISTTT